MPRLFLPFKDNPKRGIPWKEGKGSIKSPGDFYQLSLQNKKIRQSPFTTLSPVVSSESVVSQSPGAAMLAYGQRDFRILS